MKKNIFELKINNKDKDFENYLRPQWSWKTLVTIGIFCFVLIFVVKDLEIDFVKLVTDSSKYFGDILSRMLPPDFSNLNQLIYAMFETIEIAFLGTFIAIVLSIPLGLFSARNFNIESLSVAPTNNPSSSIMTIVTSGNDHVIEQIIKQLSKIIDVLASVELTASSTVLKTGLSKCDWPPLPGVTPPTIFVPYSIICDEWNVPSEPVKPWTITLEFLLTKTLITIV